MDEVQTLIVFAFSVNLQELNGIYLKNVYINSHDLGTITKMLTMEEQSLKVKAVVCHFYSIEF